MNSIKEILKPYVNTVEYEVDRNYLLTKKVNYKEFGFVDKYDESFFSNNDLIILNCNETSGSNKLSYKSHELVGNSFTVNIKRKHSYNVESTDIKVWTFFITIENDQARQINSVFTNINGELKQIRNFDIFE